MQKKAVENRLYNVHWYLHYMAHSAGTQLFWVGYGDRKPIKIKKTFKEGISIMHG